ncbi:MAG: metal-binding protein [Acidobacteria bacterium]|nr:metal-binding protein [Acidobacteriota bacterium]
MPSARAHDIITATLAPPTFAVTFFLAHSIDLSIIATAAMLFAGLMFGPDLDIQSKQYERWGPLGFLWWPYKVTFRHRSRLSHGILLGTAVRVLYFIVVLSLLVGACLFIYGLLHPQASGKPDAKLLLQQVWGTLRSVERRYFIAAFLGLWWGATSHTLTDWIYGLWTSTKKIF